MIGLPESLHRLATSIIDFSAPPPPERLIGTIPTFEINQPNIGNFKSSFFKMIAGSLNIKCNARVSHAD